MRDLNIPPSKAKLKLLDAAEQLVAERGFDVVSVRDVTQAAQANVAAVNYHFGSREGMMAIVIQRILTPIQQERLARLEVLEKKWGSKAMPLEELVDAIVRPLIASARRSELSESLHGQLVGRILALSLEILPEAVEQTMQELAARYLKALAKALPTVAKEELVWRLHFVMGGVIHLLTGQSSIQRVSQGGSGSPSVELTLNRFLRFALAGLREGVAENQPAKKGPQATFDF